MDYFHAATGMAAITGPDAFLRRAIPVPWAQLTYPCATSRPASRSTHRNSRFRQPLRRSTLADANERRDWRIHAALERLITQARTLYVDENWGWT